MLPADLRIWCTYFRSRFFGGGSRFQNIQIHNFGTPNQSWLAAKDCISAQTLRFDRWPSQCLARAAHTQRGKDLQSTERAAKSRGLREEPRHLELGRGWSLGPQLSWEAAASACRKRNKPKSGGKRMQKGGASDRPPDRSLRCISPASQARAARASAGLVGRGPRACRGWRGRRHREPRLSSCVSQLLVTILNTKGKATCHTKAVSL